MNYKEIQDLIKLVKKNQIAELEIERDDFRISIRSQGDETTNQNAPVIQHSVIPPTITQPQQSTPSLPQATPTNTEETKEDTSHFIEIKSPMIGTFYRAPGPDKDPFVSLGDQVEVDQVICMIEAMKLFNEIQSEVKGKVVKILVEDSTPVEFDQPLFLIDPNS